MLMKLELDEVKEEMGKGIAGVGHRRPQGASQVGRRPWGRRWWSRGERRGGFWEKEGEENKNGKEREMVMVI